MAIEKNKAVEHFKKKEVIENANKNMFKISFLILGIIKCN